MSRDLDIVLASYVECALWSSHDYRPESPDESEPFDAWATADDIAPETMTSMREDCVAMILAADGLPGSDWWTDEQFGHDFWLTRNGHGAGFWDRHSGDTAEARAGDVLSAMAKVYGSVDLYTGDDGKVYAS